MILFMTHLHPPLKGRERNSFPFKGKAGMGMGMGFVVQNRNGINNERPD
jgi:hypothetical protein